MLALTFVVTCSSSIPDFLEDGSQAHQLILDEEWQIITIFLIFVLSPLHNRQYNAAPRF